MVSLNQHVQIVFFKSVIFSCDQTVFMIHCTKTERITAYGAVIFKCERYLNNH